MPRHPLDGDLRAFLDGATGMRHAMLLRFHLMRCHSCRARLEEERRAGTRVESLLGVLTPRVAVTEGWERIEALHRTSSPHRRSSLRPFLAGGLAGAVACAAVLITLHGTLAQPPTSAPPVVQYGEALLDHCCADLDGDGIAHEGLLTLQRGDQKHLMMVYSDRDGSGDLSSGDVIHSVSISRLSDKSR